MIKSIVGLLGLTALGTGAMLAMPQQQEQEMEKDTTPFMLRKLDHSRDILSGLAMENYTLISRNAQDLMLLSHEADWKVITTPEYLKMSAEFRASAERLRDTAKSENLDGATLAYIEVTLNCVRCHKYIRSDYSEKK